MPQCLQQHPSYNRPIRLSREEEGDPFQVLESFFSDTNMTETVTTFDKILETCLTTDDGPFCKAEERGNLLFLRKKIERVLEACYLLVRAREKELIS
jgi:hypothetical protein